MTKIIRDCILFGAVGGIGFVVDVAVLYSLAGLIGLFYGRAVSFLAAVFVTWLLNRRWTFRYHSSSMASSQEFAFYLTLMMIGGAVNYAVYVVLVVYYQFFWKYPMVAVAVGSFSGMVINFTVSRFILYRHERKEQNVAHRDF